MKVYRTTADGRDSLLAGPLCGGLGGFDAGTGLRGGGEWAGRPKEEPGRAVRHSGGAASEGSVDEPPPGGDPQRPDPRPADEAARDPFRFPPLGVTMSRPKAYPPAPALADLPLPPPSVGPGSGGTGVNHRIGLTPRSGRAGWFILVIFAPLLLMLGLAIVAFGLLAAPVVALIPAARNRVLGEWRDWRFPVHIEVDHHPAVPGDQLEFVIHHARPVRLRSIEVNLVSVERVQYQQGTNTVTKEHRAYSAPCHLTGAPQSGELVSTPIPGVSSIPAEAMHSFRAPRNAVRWELEVVRGFGRSLVGKSTHAFDVLPLAAAQLMLVAGESPEGGR